MEKNNEFKMDVSEFQGYVKRALEDIDKNIQEIKEQLKKNGKEIGGLQVKLAGIAATIAILSTIAVNLIMNIIAK